LRGAPAAVRAELVRRAIIHLHPGGLPPTSERLQAAARLARSPVLTGTVELPDGLTVTRDLDDLRVQRVPARTAVLQGTWIVAVPGETRIPGWRIVVEPESIARPGSDRLVAWLRPEVFGGEVTVSARRAGDRIEPLGMQGRSRKVQDLLLDERVPRQARDAVPMLRTEHGIAWVVGVRIAEWAAAWVGERAMRITFYSDTTATNEVCEPCVDDVDRSW
jgi:tRNA(Ile)-lysidine synthetase-like protein